MKKRSCFVLILLTMLIVLFAIPVQAKQKSKSKSKPKLNQTVISIKTGQKVKLSVSGTKKKVSWSSSNKKVAAVSGKGAVKGVKAGTALIRAKVDGKTLKCKVTVIDSATIEAMSNQDMSTNTNGRYVYEFRQNGWFVGRLCVIGKVEGGATIETYSKACAVGEKTTITFDQYPEKVILQIAMFPGVWDDAYAIIGGVHEYREIWEASGTFLDVLLQRI